nr:MAG TPA: hypothetical protein [Bacteriophage sp.]
MHLSILSEVYKSRLILSFGHKLFKLIVLRGTY